MRRAINQSIKDMNPLPQFSSEMINKWSLEKWIHSIDAACTMLDHDTNRRVTAVTIMSWIDDLEHKYPGLSQIGSAMGDKHNLTMQLRAKGDYLVVRLVRRDTR